MSGDDGNKNRALKPHAKYTQRENVTGENSHFLKPPLHISLPYGLTLALSLFYNCTYSS